MIRYTTALTIMGLIICISSLCLAEGSALTKLGNGLNNAFTGWMEIPEQMYETSQEINALVGLTYGTAKGSGYCAARMMAGAIDAGTFIFPEYDKPIMEPKNDF